MEIVTLAHGSGGEETNNLIEGLFYKYLSNEYLMQKNDATNLGLINGEIAITTDSFVINPIFFKGGDIGKLSICGTVNDLSVAGAKPLYLSLGLIIEEGFLIKELEAIIKSISLEAEKAGVKIVCGDTKVVEKGKCDKIFINTTGVGVIEEHNKFQGIHNIKPGDKIIISGTIGDHGASILNEREYLSYDSEHKSDCAPLNQLIHEIKDNISGIKVMRDPTRGGLGTTLNELSIESGLSMAINEEAIPYKEEVLDFSNLLGLDPLYLANEGKVIIIAEQSSAENVINILKGNILGKDAAIIGEVLNEREGKVYLNTSLGAKTIISKMKGELLPRIC